MAFSIDEFRAALKFGGARNTLFRVDLTFPVGIGSQAARMIPKMAKASSLPPTEHGIIQVPVFGRTIKINGDKSYGSWTVTFYNDEDFQLRHAFEQWQNQMQTIESNIATPLALLPAQYKQDAKISQYSKDDKLLRTYKFSGLFPAQVSGIQMDWGATNQIEEFQVTFEYDYHIVDEGTTGVVSG